MVDQLQASEFQWQENGKLGTTADIFEKGPECPIPKLVRDQIGRIEGVGVTRPWRNQCGWARAIFLHQSLTLVDHTMAHTVRTNQSNPRPVNLYGFISWCLQVNKQSSR